MGYVFVVVPAHIDERAIRSEDPGALTLALAHAGGFSITDPLLEAYIERVDGTAASGIGLPTALTRRLLRAAMAAHAREGPVSAGRGESPAGGTSGP